MNKRMNIYNSTKNTLISDKVEVAKTFWTRTCGLIPRKEILKGESLMIEPCCSVHTFFMRFPIDIIFVDRENKVIALYENVGRNKALPIHPGAKYVIELCAGEISALNVEKGDFISVV